MVRRTLAVSALTITLGLVSSLAFGQTTASSGTKLDERISLSFEKAAAADILGFLARSAGFQAVIAPSLQQKISFRLEHVKVRTALDALCDSLGCRWRLEGNQLMFEAVPVGESKPAASDSDELLAPLRKVVPPGTQFNAIALASALQTLSRIAGPDVELTLGMVDSSRMVTADVSSKTIQAAIRELVAATGVSAGKTYSITINSPGRKPTKIMTVLPSREAASSLPSAPPKDVVLECEISKDGQLLAHPTLKILSGESGTISLDGLTMKVSPTRIEAREVRLALQIQAAGKTIEPVLRLMVDGQPGTVSVPAGKTTFSLKLAVLQ